MTGSFSTTTRNYRKEENVKMVKVTYKWISVGIATILHFFVDGLCLCCLYLMIPSGAHDDLLGLFLLHHHREAIHVVFLTIDALEDGL